MNQQNPFAVELRSKRDIQKFKYWAGYTASSIIKNGLSTSMIILIEQDADFEIQEMTIRARGPVESDGRPIGSSVPYAAETGVSDFPTFGASEAASGGLSFTLKDSNNRVLISNEVDVELVGTPGYGQQLYIPFKLKYTALRNTKLTFDIRNRDLAVTTPGSLDQYHAIEIALWGYKYEAYLGA